MIMPRHNTRTTIDFAPPRSLRDALQRASLELNCLMVWMRNGAQYHDNLDETVLDNAFLAKQMLEDALSEVNTLLPEIERRVTGADLA